MKFTEFSVELQDNGAIDAQSLESYAGMIKSLNGMIMKAASERLQADNEPSDYERMILRPKP
jgi:hypothetical protein